MKVALLGDVHGSFSALEMVLDHARGQETEAIWNTGDFVGYGIHPDEVVRRLRSAGAVSVVGNYDLKALAFRKKKEKWLRTKQPLKWLAFQWAYEHLSKKSRKYLYSLPGQVRMTVEGWRILLTHGSPSSSEEPLTASTPSQRLLELAQHSEADVVVCGHSHRPFMRQEGSVWFINPGSVGRPDDGDPRARYAVLELGPGVLRADHYRVEYDVRAAVAEIRRAGLPEAFAQMVLRGLSLDALEHTSSRTRTPATSLQAVRT
jgi:putative phosphoesterase